MESITIKANPSCRNVKCELFQIPSQHQCTEVSGHCSATRMVADVPVMVSFGHPPLHGFSMKEVDTDDTLQKVLEVFR